MEKQIQSEPPDRVGMQDGTSGVTFETDMVSMSHIQRINARLKRPFEFTFFSLQFSVDSEEGLQTPRCLTRAARPQRRYATRTELFSLTYSDTCSTCVM